MRWPVMAVAATALAGCAGSPLVPDAAARLLAEAPEGTPARLLLVGSRVVEAAIPIAQTSIPPAVRTAIAAVAPEGETTFQGREWGLRGAGYRIDKRYRLGGDEHLRTALIAADGSVLERGHSIPLGEVPPDVLTSALAVGPDVLHVLIVSGPVREEYWRCTVTDRIGRTFVATIGLDARLQRVSRRVATEVEVGS